MKLAVQFGAVINTSSTSQCTEILLKKIDTVSILKIKRFDSNLKSQAATIVIKWTKIVVNIEVLSLFSSKKKVKKFLTQKRYTADYENKYV